MLLDAAIFVSMDMYQYLGAGFLSTSPQVAVVWLTARRPHMAYAYWIVIVIDVSEVCP